MGDIVSVFCLLALSIQLTFSQSQAKSDVKNRELARALQLADDQNYTKAIEAFKEILDKSPGFVEGYLNIGLCYLNKNTGADTAVMYLERGFAQLTPNESFSDLGIDLQMTLAKAYQVILQSDLALDIYGYLLSNIPKEYTELAELIKKEQRMCRNAKIFVKNPIELTIKNMGSQINSKYDDHSPLISMYEDLLVFTSRRPDPKLPQLRDGQFAEKIYHAKKDGSWKPSEALRHFFKSYEHEAALSLSSDGKELFLYHHDDEGKSIYHSINKNGQWQEPTKLPRPINSEFDETHATLSADRSTLFFTSDRPGGFGGSDIYMVKRNAKGQWGQARNLGSKVNTSDDEETPFIHPDGYTLYFASEGHSSMGRMDVFYTTMNADSTWEEPVNLGFPINTPDDEFFFVPTLNKNQAYYASARFDDNYGGSDIYMVEFDTSFEGKLAIIEGEITDKSILKEGPVRLLVTRKTDQRLMGDYRPDNETGHYVLYLETGHEYEVKEVQNDKNLRTSELDITFEMAFVPDHPPFSFEEVRMDPPLVQKIAPKTFASETKMIEEQIIEEMTKVKADDYYTVQILALKHKPVFAFLYFKGLNSKDIQAYTCSDGYTRYLYGVYQNKEASLKAREDLKRFGKFTDAFVRPLSDMDSLKVN